MKNKFLLLTIGFALFVGCDSRYTDEEYFNGNISIIEDTVSSIQYLPTNQLVLNGTNYGFISVYDSLMFFMNPKLKNHSFHVFNINTKEEIGMFCNRGNGPEEIIACPPISQFIENKNADLRTFLFAINEEKLFIWNITQSLIENTTVFDSIIPFDWMDKNNGACYNNLYLIDKNKILAGVNTLPLNETEATLPFYQIREIPSNNLLRTIPIYKKQVKISKDAIILPECVLSSHDAVKPDGRKIAQAMRHLPQLNIVNIENGEVLGFRLDKKDSFDTFRRGTKIKNYFHGIQADNHYIYAAFGEYNLEDENQQICTLYIFNWDGSLIKKIKTDIHFRGIWLDTCKKRMYFTSTDSDDIFYLNTGQIIQQ